MKTLSLLKAALSQDMNMFKYKTAKNSSKLTKLLFPVFLFIIVCFSIGVYTYMIAEKLHPFNLTYIMLTIIFMTVILLTFMSGIYKSQGILFEAKDNDLLFSLPIPKSKILASRAFLTFSFITPPTNIKSGPKFPLLSYVYYIILFLNYKHLF